MSEPEYNNSIGRETLERLVAEDELGILDVLPTVAAVPRWTASDLDAMPTIEVGYTAGLKLRTRDLKIWLHRTTKADGEEFERAVTIEFYDGHCWSDLIVYEGAHERNEHRRSRA